jgi:hypothetical protein
MASSVRGALAAALTVVLAVAALPNMPLYEYVSKPDPHYSWFDTGYRINETGLVSRVLGRARRPRPAGPAATRMPHAG